MAGLGQNGDRFAPGGAQEVSVMGGGFQLGRLKSAPNLPSVLGSTPAAIMKPHQMTQSGPRGAQTIPVVGMSPGNQGMRLLGSPARPPAPLQQHRLPAPRRQIPEAPASAPVSALPSPRQQQYSMGETEEMRTFEIRGLAPDGIEYAVRFDGVFPRNTKMLGVTEVTGT
jgi:hypothetical protein